MTAKKFCRSKWPVSGRRWRLDNNQRRWLSCSIEPLWLLLFFFQLAQPLLTLYVQQAWMRVLRQDDWSSSFDDGDGAGFSNFMIHSVQVPRLSKSR
jgi:hypothetical protein